MTDKQILWLTFLGGEILFSCIGLWWFWPMLFVYYYLRAKREVEQGR